MNNFGIRKCRLLIGAIALSLAGFLFAANVVRASGYYNVGLLKTPSSGSTTLTTISPASGFAGTTLTINGTGFTSGTTVTVGGVTCTSPVLISSTQLTCTLPTGSGTGSVVATTAGSNATLSNAFTYATCSMSAVRIAPSNAGPGTNVQIIQEQPSLSQTITNTAGDLLVAIAYSGQGSGTQPNMMFTVTDTNGNTYYPGQMINNPSTGQGAASQQIFYALNIAGGANTVTATAYWPTLLTNAPWTGLAVIEYSGVATSNAVSISSAQAAPSSTSTTTPGAVTTTTGCDLAVGGFADGTVGGNTSTAGSGYTLRMLDNFDPAGWADNIGQLAAAGTSVNPAVVSPNSANGWVSSQLVFRSSATQAPPQPTQIAFATSAQTIASTYTCSTALTIQSQNSSGAATNTSTGISVNLSGTGLQFFADSGCVYPISNALIGAGQNSQTVYFEGGTVGANIITGSATGFTSITQSETISAVGNYTWIGGGTCTSWATASCWKGGAVPGSTAIAHFDGNCTTNCSPTLAANTTVGGIWMASGYTGTITQGAFTLTIKKDFREDAGTFTGGSTTISVAGNWILNGGTFTPGTSTVSFTDASHTISGSTTFYNLSKAATTTFRVMTFAAGSTQTVTNALTMAGASGGSKTLFLRSTVPGSQWNLVPPAGTTLAGYLNIQDSNSTVAIHTGTGSTLVSNNTNWTAP